MKKQELEKLIENTIRKVLSESDINHSIYMHFKYIIDEIGGEFDERRSHLHNNDSEIWFKYEYDSYGIFNSFGNNLALKNETTNKTVEISSNIDKNDFINAIKKTQK